MIKCIGKRVLAIMMVIVMVFALMPVLQMPVSAADVNTGVTGLTAYSSGDAEWKTSGNTITGSVTAYSSTGCSGPTYTKRNGSLTIMNSSDATALLSFDYTLTLSSGSATVDGMPVSAGTGFSKKLEADETVTVAITSNATDSNATSITISNLKLTPEVNVDVSFKAPTNGSYTVDGTAVTADTVKTLKTTDSVDLDATPANGYKFFGWYSETTDSFFAFKASLTTSFTESITVEPRFVLSTVPIFQVGSMLYTDLNEAINYAQSSGTEKIVLIANGTLPAGDYTIPSGKTLLIPFDDAQTIYTTAPEVVYGSHANPSAFRTLTMASGARIKVASGGAISVPSKLSATGTNSGSWNGTPTGNHGRITMSTGSSIDVQSGGKLYVYGYISGSGNVYARSKSEVWECFQIRCWRGGTATSGMADNKQKVFPINQYYVQNIEAPITYYSDAVEKVYTAVNMSSKAFAASATFIGNGGMFNIASGSATKRFNGATDRLELSVDGNFSITPMSLRIAGLPLIGTLDLNTADYTLPIQSNITINVNSGTTTLSQDVAFMAGAEMMIAYGATVEIASGKNVYVYDQDQWGPYAAAGLQLVPVGYSTVNGATAKRTTASLVDAKIDVNGTLNVKGSLYTTENGAAIVSSGGTGKVILAAKAGTENKTYMATQSGSDISYVEITITAAQLQNADSSYYETAGKPANTEIPYTNGVWGSAPLTFTVSFDANTGEGTMDPQTFTEGQDGQLNANSFTKTGYHFTGWNTAADGSGSSIPDKYSGTIPGASDLTLFAQWQKHEEEVRGAVEATCTEPGYTGDTYCQICGETTADGTAIDALGHDWGEGNVTTEPSCEGAGVKTYTCSRCGETHNEAINPTGHTPEEVSAVDPTCTAPGLTSGHKCSVCDSILDGCVEIPALGHIPATDAAIEPSCTETGLSEGTHCSVCGEVLVAQEVIPAFGHFPEVRGEREATLTEEGYTGDTYCSICGELLEKGEVIPKTGVTITFDVNGGDGDTFVMVLSADDRLLFEDASVNRDGFELISWNTEADGTGVDYDPDGSATFVEDTTLYAQWSRINGWYQDGEDYFYSKDGQNVTGIQRLPYPNEELLSGYNPDAEDAAVNVPGKEGNPDNYDYPDEDSALFVFDENGVFQKDMCKKYNDNGVTRWIQNGMVIWHMGLVQNDEDYYYFKRNGIVTDQETYVAKTNGLLPAAKYTFDSDGRLMKLNGLHKDLNGNLCYYVDYVKNYAGLVKDEEGNYYYIASDLTAVKDTTYYVTKTNDLLPAGYYVFDEEGRIIIREGFVEENGEYYYFENGSKVDKGLVEHDGAYYYFPSSLKAVKNEKHYVFADKSNGLVDAGWYWFDADGKMFRDGLREENGKLYFYKDGVKNYAGLIEIDGDYYYIKSDCSAVTNQSYYVTRNNGLMDSKTYLFGEDGKMIMKNGIYREKLDDGKEYLFYYVDNVRQMNTGLTQLDDGRYIYVRSGADLAVGDYYVYKNNDLLPRGTYHFGDDGIMIP